MRLRLREVLDSFASVAMITASIGIVLALLGVIGPSRGTTKSETRQTYIKGELFPHAVDVPKGRPVAILWLSSRCPYCEESMPFYRRTIEAQGAESIVVMGTEPETQLRDYLSKHGLGTVQVRSVPHGSLKFSGTPALALLDSNRQVARVWVGKVPSSVEEEILTAFSRLRGGFD